MIGTVLQGKYKVERKIGEGGFAKVYRGFHEQLKRTVAIKVLEELGERSRFKSRFLREAVSMGQLNHPNIVTVYDCAEYKGQPYLVMEYVNGPTLLQLVGQRSLALPQISEIAVQICQEMSYAHKQGIIHRDLSLRNIMLSEEEHHEPVVKILDFNLAKLLHDAAHTTGKAMMGTPYYMAPEQIRNETVDGRVDIFAFGVGLHRMVNGRFPFEAQHPAALMYLVLNEFEIEFADGVPESMRDVILRCLEKDPRSRARSFDELLADLESIRKECRKIDTAVSNTLTGLDIFAERGSKRNPYLNRVMIKHPSDFFGRKAEVRKIYSRLDAPHPQSISVVGERRIGKSSLLNYIYHPKNRKRNMNNHQNSIFVYLDFQRDVDFDMPKFIHFLFNMFSYEMNGESQYTKREETLDQLKDVIQELHGKGKRIIILMDEFESITRNKNFDERFFSFLRSLANSYRVAYVTSSYEELQFMCHNKDVSDSPFFNIFSNLPLRPFQHDEALELISVPSKTEAVPLEQHADKIIELAGYFPFFLQIACSNVFEHLVDNPDAEPDWGEITRSFVEEVYPHYHFVWERMDGAAQENLHRVAAGKPTNKKLDYVNEDLIRRGYLRESNGRLEFCSTVCRQFVLEQKQKRDRKKSFLGSLFKRRQNQP
ncbi:MAG: protein kinase [Candidatus Latescibacterota bacterium]|nr:MAG: protein kinase [Candidatus Latescibacterota bacterium]